MALEMYFVTAYFGEKTYPGNGIAIIRDEPGKQRVVTVASWCGGPEFVVEEWPADTLQEWRNGKPLADVPDQLFTEAEKLLKGSGLTDMGTRARLGQLLGPALVNRIHAAAF